jgi:hypothetical protein
MIVVRVSAQSGSYLLRKPRSRSKIRVLVRRFYKTSMAMGIPQLEYQQDDIEIEARRQNSEL